MKFQNAAQNKLFSEHVQWLNYIETTKPKICDLRQKLADVIPHFTGTQMMPCVEQFQNRFIRQREVIDELRHEIKQHENHLERLDQPSHLLLLTHISLREQFNRFLDLYIELERDFDEFLA